jgi:hypothetical protein
MQDIAFRRREATTSVGLCGTDLLLEGGGVYRTSVVLATHIGER